MRKHFLLVIFIATVFTTVNAQGSRGVRIGYIDMEYILQNVPDYAEANNQLEQKAQKWKQELDAKNNEITKLKDNLKTEQVLLTKQLIEEREEEIKFLETELSDIQQKRFGSNGDLMIQKALLVKPIQDQVFTAVQDLATAQKYDFIFDKSSDLTMLFAANRFDLSDRIIRVISRANKKDERSKKQIKADEIKENQEDLEDANPAIAERKKKIEDNKAARLQRIEDNKVLVQQRKDAILAKRQENIDARNAKKGIANPAKAETKATSDTIAKVKNSSTVAKDSMTAQKINARNATIAANKKSLEERKKQLADKKAKTLADRDSIKKARAPKINNPNK